MNKSYLHVDHRPCRFIVRINVILTVIVIIIISSPYHRALLSFLFNMELILDHRSLFVFSMAPLQAYAPSVYNILLRLTKLDWVLTEPSSGCNEMKEIKS
jgi:hypothetical protein